MPMTVLESDTINLAFAVCRTVLMQLEPQLSQLQQSYDSAGGVKETLSQAEMDEAPVLSGLTKTQLDDGVYVLTTLLLPAITQGVASLSQLSARYRGMLPPPPVVLP